MADDIDDIGTAGVISKIKDRIGDRKVYLTVDIDVLDPGIAPGTVSRLTFSLILDRIEVVLFIVGMPCTSRDRPMLE